MEQEASTEREGDVSDDSNSGQADAAAEFLGWQRTGSGEFFAIFNVTAPNHPARGSTVSEKGLGKLNLHVPQTEPLQEKGMP